MVATDLRDTNGWISSHDPLTVIPLTDPVIDQLGHDVRSSYVETYWLPILGPSAIWAARRLAEWLESSPEGVEAPLEPLARSLGLGGGTARHAPIVRTLVRLVDFRLASIGGSTYGIRTDLPPTTGSTHHPAAPIPGPQPSARARGDPMSDQSAVAEIEEGREGWGSHLAPPEPPCECVVQHTVQSEPVCTGNCTAHCTSDCTTRRITLAGVRGGSGTSTVAAALALISRTMVHTELATADPVLTSALLGVTPPDQLLAEVLGRFVLAQEASGEAELTIVDAGTVTEAAVGPRASGERRLGVLRGPCYLALRTLLAGQHGLDGLVLVAEPGRALNERDVADVTGLDVVAVVPVSPGVARTIDAGLLAARHQNQREFRDLRRWLTTQLDPFPSHRPPRRVTAPNQPEMAGTDLPGALCAPGGAAMARGAEGAPSTSEAVVGARMVQ